MKPSLGLPDVVVLPTREMVRLKSRGLLASYEPPEAAAYPSDMRNPYFTVCSLKPYGLVYSKALVGQDAIPQRYSDLAEPRWKTGLIHVDPVGNEDVLLWFAHMMEVLGPSLLKKIFHQASACVKGFEQAVEGVSAGKSLAAFPVKLDKPLWKEGSLGVAFMAPTFIETESVALLATAAHPNAAKLFINYLLGEEGQQLLARQGRIPARPHISSGLELTNLDPIFDLEEFDVESWRPKAAKLYGGFE